jgi:hypothetical protein
MKLRCSSLPRIVTCPQSGIVPDGAIAIEGDSAAARLGLACHVLLADFVRTGEFPADSRKREVVMEYLLDEAQEKELGFLLYAGWEAWKELRGSFEPEPLVEIPMELTRGDFTLTGRMDVARDCDVTVYGLDWKSGRKPHDYLPQMRGYGAELFANFPAAQKAVLIVVWLREKMTDTFVWTRSESDAWLAETVARVTSGIFCPGEACRFCPRSLDCPARTAMVRSVLADMTDAGPQFPALTAEAWAAVSPSLTTAWGRVKLVETAIEQFKAVVRDGVERFGPLSITDKTELRLVPVSPKKSLDTAKAWPIVAQQLTDEELEEVTTVKLSDVNTIVAKKAGRGKGKAAKAALEAQLREAGAILETPMSARLTEVRTEDKTETKEVE